MHNNAIFCYKYECTLQHVKLGKDQRNWGKKPEPGQMQDIALLPIFHGKKFSQGGDSRLDYIIPRAITCGTTQLFFTKHPRTIIRIGR